MHLNYSKQEKQLLQVLPIEKQALVANTPIATNGEKKKTIKAQIVSCSGEGSDKNAPSGRHRNQWSKISTLDIKKCYYSILDSYGTLQGKDLEYYTRKKLTNSREWTSYVDGLVPFGSQAISTTFLWFAKTHLENDIKQPIEITKIILHYYKANSLKKKIDLTVGYPTCSIIADIKRFVAEYNENKLYPDRIKKERETAKVLALLCAKQLSESESLLGHKDTKALKVYTSLEHLSRFLNTDKLILKRHLRKLSAVGFILRTDLIWKNKIGLYLNKNVFTKW